MIKQRAEELGIIPKVEVKKVEGMRYEFADFEGAGVVVHKDGLPKDLWLKGDPDQFNWLNKRLPEDDIAVTVEGLQDCGQMRQDDLKKECSLWR